MNAFTKRELIGSLFCPIYTFLWGTGRFLVDISWGITGKNSFRLATLTAIFIGGVLPVFLTLTLKIHTEQYLKKRLITIVVIYIANGFIGLIGYPIVMLPMYMIFGVGAIIFQILKVQEKDTLGKERVVLMVSDPIIYWTMYWLLYWTLNW